MRDDIKKSFGKSLFQARHGAKLTLEGLSNKANLTLRYIQDVEAGNKLPSILTLIKICNALDITPNDILLPVIGEYKNLKEKENTV